MITTPLSVTINYLAGSPEDGCACVESFPYTIYRIPRDYVSELKDNPTLKRAGIYLLINTENLTVYVGQSDVTQKGGGVLDRMLAQHSAGIDDSWDVGFAMTSESDSVFDATALNYLERHFYNIVDAGLYTVLNSFPPHGAKLAISKKIVLDNFTDLALFLLREHLHLNVALSKGPVHKAGKTVPEGGIAVFLSKSGSGADAKAIYLPSKQTIVLQGSTVSEHNNLGNQKGQESNNRLRRQLEETGIITDRKFTENYTFPASSPAASVVMGTAASGNHEWLTDEGVRLGDAL